MEQNALDSTFAHAVLIELQRQTDRGVAVSAGSYVENSLERFIRGMWLQETTTEGSEEKRFLKNLFHPSGALGSFAVKIKVAFMSRLITRDACRDMENIKEIRNAFAHRIVWDATADTHEVLSFDTQSIADRCNNLILWHQKDGVGPRELRIMPDSPRNKYIVACVQWSQILDAGGLIGQSDTERPLVKHLFDP